MSWLWGEHLEPYQPENPPSPNSNINRVGLPSEEKASQRYRSLSPQTSQARVARIEANLKNSSLLNSFLVEKRWNGISQRPAPLEAQKAISNSSSLETVFSPKILKSSCRKLFEGNNFFI